MFTERVNELFALLDATSAEISRFAGCDRSLISRLKSGERTPKPSSNSVVKLVNGIFIFADDKGKTKKLISAISCPNENPSSDEINKYILKYLYDGYSENDIKAAENKKRKKSGSTYAYEAKPAFGIKFDAVMGIADISNVRLSKILHIDASTISRFRKGLRLPKPNGQLIDDITKTLFGRILELDRFSELLSLAKIPDELSGDKEECYERFCNWLCDFKENDTSSFVENLLDNISSFSADIKTPLPRLDDAAFDIILQGKETVYYGTDGIRTAVIRFLGTAIKTGAKELWLYSDQNMEWLTGDTAFRLKWAALMQECVKRGIKIRIIHSINRNLDEMASAINNWLPLYMSGMIEPYYCKRQGDGKFSTTLFLCPGAACISSVHAYGCEDKGIYRYDTDEKTLKIHKIYYEKLLKISKPLVKIYREPEENKICLDSTGVTTIMDTLSLATMPEALIKGILHRSDLSKTLKEKALAEWESKSRAFDGELKNGFIHECICPARDELLFSGNVPIDLQSSKLTYSPQEYGEHIKNIISVFENHSNYRFYALPEAPFTNIVMVVSDNSVVTTRLLPPQTTFVFSHPAMCEAFSGYAEHLKEQYMQDKITTKRFLERYI